MSLIKRYIGIVLCCYAIPLAAQQEMSPEEIQYNLRMQAEIHSQLNRLTAEINQLADEQKRQSKMSEKNLRSAYFVRMMDEKNQSMTKRMQALDVRWEAFNASNLAFIADNDTLMEMMTKAQLLKQEVTDSLTVQQSRCQAVKDFAAAEECILGQDTVYDKLYKQAFAMSFVQKMSPQLEKLKAQEQLQFADIQAQYDKAKAAADAVPQLQSRAEKVNQCFYSIKAQSEKIQQMKYMPLIQRIKEYIMSLAYVAVILIFFNMIVSKWQAAKKTKEALKQQAEQLKKQKENEYPTI